MGYWHYINLRIRSIRGRYGNGIFPFVKALFHSLIKVNTFVVNLLDLEAFDQTVPREPSLRLLGPDLAGFKKLREGEDLPMEFHCDAYYGDGLCFYAVYEGRLAAVNWVYRAGEFSRFLKLGEKDAEVNYVFTLPDFRGRALSTKLKIFTAGYLREKGYKRLFSVVHKGNIANLKSDAKVGFTCCGTLKTLGHFSKKMDFSE